MHRYISLDSMDMDDCIPHQTPKQVSDIIGFTLLITEGYPPRTGVILLFVDS